MTNNYRIVRDSYNGYEAQVKYWWFPIIWFQIGASGLWVNTSTSLEKAKEVCEWHKNKHFVLWQER